MRTTANHLLRALGAAAGLTLTIVAGAAQADSNTPPNSTDMNFGSRTEKPDGSVAMTMGRRLPTEWQAEAKVGTDVNLASPLSSVPSDNFLHGVAPDRSTGAIWGNLTMPGLAPDLWDKTTIDARIDGAQDQGKLGATLSRSVPLGNDLSVTLQNSYSVARPLPDRQPAPVTIPLMATPAPLPAAPAEGTPTWQAGQSVRLDIDPSGTALSAGGSTSNSDELWHNKLSVEQKQFGPLKLTTSVEDAGTAASKKSISAGFKRVW
jgi:hypothetical protein